MRHRPGPQAARRRLLRAYLNMRRFLPCQSPTDFPQRPRPIRSDRRLRYQILPQSWSCRSDLRRRRQSPANRFLAPVAWTRRCRPRHQQVPWGALRYQTSSSHHSRQVRCQSVRQRAPMQCDQGWPSPAWRAKAHQAFVRRVKWWIRRWQSPRAQCVRAFHHQVHWSVLA